MKHKVGDKVRVKSLAWYNENKDINEEIQCGDTYFVGSMTNFCGLLCTIEIVDEESQAYYLLEDTGYFRWTDEMLEGLVEEETKPNVIEEAKTYWDSIKDAWICPEGYIFKDENGNVINATKIILEKKKKEYPKTFEECVHVLEGENRMSLEQMNTFRKLIDARNAYWKIAGEEMGLGKPWKPDWTDHELMYCIKVIGNTLKCVSEMNIQCILAFPTEEMRDAFKENFDPDIEICKEFL